MTSSMYYSDLYDSSLLPNSLAFYGSSWESLENCQCSSVMENWIYSNYHFLCKKCVSFMKIIFGNQEKIKIICSCKDSPKEIYFNKIFDNIDELKDENNLNENLKCKIHGKKYLIYCKKCEKNFCKECYKECALNNHEKIFLQFNLEAIKKINYISKKIKEKDKHFIESNIQNFTLQNDNNKPQNNNKEEDINNINNKDEININFINENKIDYSDYHFNIFKIIINNDFNKIPNYK